MSYLSYSDGLWDGWQMAKKKLFCGGVTSRICSKQHIAFLCGTHQVSSLRVSVEFRRCNHKVVPIWPKLERNPVISYQGDLIFTGTTAHMKISLCLSYAYVDTAFNRWALLSRIGLLISEAYSLKWRWLFFSKTHELCFICVHVEANVF